MKRQSLYPEAGVDDRVNFYLIVTVHVDGFVMLLLVIEVRFVRGSFRST